MALGVALVLADDLKALLCHGLGEGLGVLDDLGRILLTVLKHLRCGDDLAGHVVEVVVAEDTREDGPLELCRVLPNVLVYYNATLRAGEGLVGGGGYYLRPLPEWILELTAGYEAEDVGRIVHHVGSDFLGHRCEFLNRVGERVERAAEDDQLGLYLSYEPLCLVDVDVELLVVKGPGVNVEAAHSGTSKPCMAYVSSMACVEAYYVVAGLGQAKEHRLVGIGSGDGP